MTFKYSKGLSKELKDNCLLDISSKESIDVHIGSMPENMDECACILCVERKIEKILNDVSDIELQSRLKEAINKIIMDHISVADKSALEKDAMRYRYIKKVNIDLEYFAAFELNHVDDIDPIIDKLMEKGEYLS